MAAYIHHVQLSTKDGLTYVQKFVQNANFKLFAERSTSSLKQWAVRSGSTVFVISQPVKMYDHNDELMNIKNGHSDQEIYQSACFPSSSKDQSIDSVFNVAFEVLDVEQFAERAHRNGARIVCQPTVIHTESGKIHIALVQSCLGNVMHTILNTSEYGGIFLPGFSDSSDLIDNSKADESDLTTHIDHVTFATGIGESTQFINWYERCFGMKRFMLSRDESDSDGFVVEGPNVGLRMKALEYWQCAETGCAMPKPDNGHPMAKFVIGEALVDQGRNQISTFLKDHDGPGIQHIALYAPNIIDTVNILTKNGLDFMQIPDTYYTEVGKLTEILEVGENPEDLKQFGILLDAESFDKAEEQTQEELMLIEDSKKDGAISSTTKPKYSYLMQIFTKPIFDRDTFFLEFIKRCGATGFGSGNIIALSRAVEYYIKNKSSL